MSENNNLGNFRLSIWSVSCSFEILMNLSARIALLRASFRNELWAVFVDAWWPWSACLFRLFPCFSSFLPREKAHKKVNVVLANCGLLQSFVTFSRSYTPKIGILPAERISNVKCRSEFGLKLSLCPTRSSQGRQLDQSTNAQASTPNPNAHAVSITDASG